MSEMTAADAFTEDGTYSLLLINGVSGSYVARADWCWFGESWGLANERRISPHFNDLTAFAAREQARQWCLGYTDSHPGCNRKAPDERGEA